MGTVDEKRNSLRGEVRDEISEDLQIGKIPKVLRTLKYIFFDRKPLADAVAARDWSQVAKPFTFFFWAVGVLALGISLFGHEPAEAGLGGKVYEKFLPLIFILLYVAPFAIGLHAVLGRRRTSIADTMHIGCYLFGALLLVGAVFSPWLDSDSGGSAETLPPGIMIPFGVLAGYLLIRSINFYMYFFKIGVFRYFLAAILANIIALIVTLIAIAVLGGIVAGFGAIFHGG